MVVFHFASFGMFGYVLYNSGLLYAFILFEIYLTAMRLHDCNISGWFSLLLFLGALLVPLVLFMCIYPGTKGANRFGSDPSNSGS